QFRELYAEQMANQGATPFDFTIWNANTDWQDQIFQNGFLTYNNASITGATEKNRFYMGLGFINEEGIIKHELYRKYTLNFSDELRVTRGLRFGITMNAYRAELPRPDAVAGGQIGSAIRAAPIAPVMDPGTGLFHTLPSFQRAQVFNPLVGVETEKNTLVSREYRAVGSIYGEVDFLRHFNFRAQLFADYGFNTSRSYQPILEVHNPEIVGNNKRDTSRRTTSVSQSQNIYPKTQMDYLLTYKNRFGDHDLTVLGGITTYYRAFEGTNASIQQGTSQVIPNNPDKWYVDAVGDPSTRLGSGSAWEDASLSYLGRILYNYMGKYLINASVRRDGSSQFYRLGNQWKTFGAVGLGWVVSREDFFRDQHFLDYLKLKGSWGVLGNKNIDEQYRYPAYPTLTNANAGVFGNNVVAALERQYIADPNLNWETVHSWETGVELRAFRNRLFFEANYYSKLTKDVLTLIEGPSGTIPGLGNLGEVENKGFEFTGTWNQSLGRDFNFSISGNLTTINNKVNKLNKTGFAIVNGPAVTTAGNPIGSFFGYISEGIYQTKAEILRSPVNTLFAVQPGDIKYKDINGDGQITTADRTIIGNPTPDFIYGGTLSANYKGLDLGIDLQGVYGNEIFRAWSQGTFADFNYLAGRLNRWHGVGTSNWEPILSTRRSNNYQNSTYWIEDGSFFRIRNVQLGYTFGAGVLNRLRLKSLRIYVNAQNLATFANST
ncbi:MAG: SusC/RagA family TonB-linked outer membrane protein, partial [Flavisolibacter sp.]|nr:SusC/RagA family TonB-linked outer membrane protein [Flavisolibacter sp.]